MTNLPVDPYSQPGPIEDIAPKQEVAPGQSPSLDHKDLKSWWEKIRASETKRRDELEKAYETAINYYKSKQFPDDNSAEDAVVVNYIASTFRLMMSSAYPNQPEYRISGKNQVGEVTKRIAEIGLNYYCKETNVEDENTLVFIDSLLCGEGVALEAHSSQLVYTVEPKSETSFPTPDAQDKNDTGVNKKPDEVQYAEYIKRSIPVTFRISPKDFIRDITAKSFSKARWCGRRISGKPIEEVLDNSLYRTEALKKLEQSVGRGDGKTADIYELQVKRRVNGDIELWRLVLCEQLQDDYLYWDKEVYEGEGFNYELIQPNKLGDDIFAIAEFTQYKGPQDQLNQIHSKINAEITKQQTQAVLNEDALTKKGKTAFLRGDGIISVKSGINDVRSVLGVVETSKVHPDLYRYEAMARDVFRIVSGIGETMRAGMQGTASGTLGEAQMIQGGSNLALTHFSKAIRRFLIKQGRKKLQIIRQFNTEAQMLPIVGEAEGLPEQLVDGKFLKFSGEYIRGEYDIDIDIDTMKQFNEAQDKAEFERMVKGILLLEPGLAREGKRVKYYDLAREWLTKFNKYNPSRYFEDLNLRNPDEENLAIIAMGHTGSMQPFMAQDGEDHDAHLAKHMEFAQSKMRQLVPPQVWAGVVEPHIADTMKRIEDKKKQMANAVSVNK